MFVDFVRFTGAARVYPHLAIVADLTAVVRLLLLDRRINRRSDAG